MSHQILKLFSKTKHHQIDLCDYSCGMQCIVKCVENISQTNENGKTLAKKHQKLLLTIFYWYLVLEGQNKLEPDIKKNEPECTGSLNGTGNYRPIL